MNRSWIQEHKLFRFFHWLPIAILGGVLLFVLFFSLLSRQALVETAQLKDLTLSSLEQRVLEYETYQANDRTKSLIRLLDKTAELARDLSLGGEVMRDEEALQRYVHEQRLTGVLILGDTLAPELQTGSGHISANTLKEIRASKNIRQILECPESAYMIRAAHNGRVFDTAVVSRQDADGVIICYAMHADLDSSGEITLESIFDGMILRKNGIIAITDGARVLASNRKALASLGYADAAGLFTTGSLTPDSHGLIRLHDGKESWYGGEEHVRGYTLYAFFPASEIFSTRTTVLIVVVSAYVIFWMLLMLMQSLLARRTMRREDEQLHIIEAIGQVYMTILLVSLEDGRARIIKSSEHFQTDMASGTQSLETMMRAASRFVAEPQREEFLTFTDYTTVASRLQSHNVLSLSFEADTGWLNASVIPQQRRADSSVVTALYLFRDITEERLKEIAQQKQLRRAMEQAQRASIAKTDFLRRMSHDIRTPINGIHGMLDIADHYPDDMQRQQECRRKIRQASAFLLDLVNSVLDMNKLESGEIKLTNEPFRLSELMQSVDAVAEVQAGEASIRYTCLGTHAEHDHLLGSPVHLRQVFQNLTSNAIKYNRPGGSVTVSYRETGSDGVYADFVFICADTGIGMSEEFQKHAFEPFSQENSKARTAYSGTGLGLSITKELVETMGGTICMESKQDVGTRFTVTLHLRIDRDAAQRHQDTLAAAGSIKGTKILLVEDNEMNMEIAQFLLNEQGAVLTKAWNGQQAIDLFTQSPPGTFDIILMDVMMPVLNGIEATQRIRAMDRPDAKTSPIFAMTANAFSDDNERSRKAGMNEHLTKPLDRAVLTRLIARYRNADTAVPS